jgi:peptide/nickel transport system substrate-binding protein
LSLLLVLAMLAAPADTLVVGLLTDPVSLDPHRATDLVSAAIVTNACDTLVRFRSGASRPEAALATTWATVNNRTWTFTLREGVRFHDGVAFDADAVVANVENLARDHGFPGHAERVGPHVVAITLDKPSAAFLATLSQPFFSMTSPRWLAEPGTRAPVGTGPFRLKAARPGLVQLEANADHWGGAPRLAHVLFRRYASENALASALLVGEVDVTSAVGQDRVLSLRGNPELSLDSQTGLNIAFLSINNEHAPLGDVRVRQAIARAIDREALLLLVPGGHGEPAKNPLPPLLWGYSPRTRDLHVDRAAARRLLADAGLPDGFETTILSVDSGRPYMPDPRKLSARIRDDLAAIGVRARSVPVASWAEYVARGSRGDYALMPLGWQADTTDPNDFLSALLASESIGTTNRSRYQSPEMDGLLKRGRRAPDIEGRTKAYHAAQELFQRDMPWVPLYHVSVFTASRRSVGGLAIGATGILRYDKAWKSSQPPAISTRP